MTKLPVAGQKYRAKNNRWLELGQEVEVIGIAPRFYGFGTISHKEITLKVEHELYRGEAGFKYEKENFWDYFEELPEDNSQQTEEKPKSIWKDVSELPDIASEAIYIRYNNKVLQELRGKICLIEKGYNFTTLDWETIPKICIEKFCTITDFINAFEQMQRDIQELKKGEIK